MYLQQYAFFTCNLGHLYYAINTKMVLTQQRIKVGDIFIGIHVEVDIRIILHDLSLFVRKETLDVDIEMIKMVRKFILKGGEQACWRREGFDPKDIREFFQFTVKDEVI